MNKKLNWGVLGYARIAKNSIIPALMECEDAKLYAIASRSEEKLDEAISTFGFEKGYRSYDELLEDPNVDVVYIPLPNTLHKEWVLKACRNKKHVLCEKPMATTREDAILMAEEARKNGVFLMEAFMYRFLDKIKKLNEVISSGVLGDIKMVKVSWRFFLDRPECIKYHPELGGGAMWDVGCYAVNIISMILGNKPSHIMAMKNTKKGIDDSLCAILAYENGVMAQLDCGFDSVSSRTLEIAGSKASLLVPEIFVDTDEDIIVKDGKLNKIQVISSPVQNRYLEEVKSVTKAIKEGKTELLSLSETIGNIDLISKILSLAISVN